MLLNSWRTRSSLSNIITSGALQLGKLFRQQDSQSSIFHSRSEFSLFRLPYLSPWAVCLFVYPKHSHIYWPNRGEHGKSAPTASRSHRTTRPECRPWAHETWINGWLTSARSLVMISALCYHCVIQTNHGVYRAPELSWMSKFTWGLQR